MAENAKTVEAHEAMKMQVKQVKNDAHLAGLSSTCHSFICSTEEDNAHVSLVYLLDVRGALTCGAHVLYAVSYWVVRGLE